ncbi:MAG: ATP-binding protein [Oscillospiraceae bacterium]|nr:ATP-binding protein [Oscillospiraceae bacterium]
MNKEAILGLSLPEPSRLCGREAEAEKLNAKLKDSRQCVLVMGPRGAGKSTFLRQFFNPEYRLELALEQRCLATAPTRYPADMTYNEIYAFFTDTIVQAAFQLLSQLGDAAALDSLRQSLMDSSFLSTGAAKMQNLVSNLGASGYTVTIVLDNFEQFTSSRDVQEKHHGVMNAMVDKNDLRLVAATDYDLNRTSLTSAGVDSLLIQKFGGGELLLGGLPADACLAWTQMAEEKLGLPTLAEKEILAAVKISGGLPALFQAVLRQFWAVKAQGGALAKELTACAERAYSQTSHTMEKWCEILGENQVYALYELDNDKRPHINTEAWNQACKALAGRGLLVPAPQGGYAYNSLLFKMHCERCRDLGRKAINDQEELMENLQKAIDQGNSDRVAVLFASMDEASKIHFMNKLLNATDPTSPILEEEYAALKVTPGRLARLTSRMQECLNDAIRVSRGCKLLREMPVENRPGCDYAIYAVGFTRSCELQIQECLFPLIEVLPEEEGRTRQELLELLLQWDPHKVLDLERGASYLTQFNYENFLNNGASRLGQHCVRLGLPEYDQDFWRTLGQSVKEYRVTRNTTTHPGTPMQYVEIERVMKVIFDKVMFQLLAARRLTDLLKEEAAAAKEQEAAAPEETGAEE